MRKNLPTILLVILFVAMIGIVLYWLPNISVEALLNHTPSNPIAAAAFFLLLYAFKSLTVFIPVIVLEAAAGLVFPVWLALGVNLLGMAIILTIPYFVGKRMGMGAIQQMLDRYPKFHRLMEKQPGNSLFLCFFLRILSCFPGDIVTMYLGATTMSFWHNLLGGILGVTPSMILATLIGQSIQDPGSPMFWISAVLMVLLAGSSALLYRRKMKKEGQT